MKVAITTSSFAKFSKEPLRLLEERGITPIMNPHGRALTEEEVSLMLQDCIAVAAGTEPLTAAVMEANPQLRVISRCGVGIDNVDTTAAQAKNITVCCTPNGPTLAVVELTIGFALDLLRHISLMDREMRAGTWKKRMGNLLSGKTVGVIGFGRIGRAVANAFIHLGCTVLFHDPFVQQDETGRCTSMNLKDLLAQADIVTLHCAKPANGKAVLDANAIAGMKQGGWLINIARGGLIDEDALCNALQNGHLSGAALDVYTKEPYEGPLTQLPNVLLTPHIGSYAKEARIQMEIDTIRNLLNALDTHSA